MSAISGPNGPEGAAEQFKQFSDQFVEDLNRIPGVDEEVIKQVLQGVCEAPPEERFTDSMRIFREELQGKIGEDLNSSDFEIQVVERLVPVLFDRLNPDIEEVQEDFLEVVVANREAAEVPLILTVFLEKLSDSLTSLYERNLTDETEVDELLPSILIALNGRLVTFQEDGVDTLYKDLIEDIVYANYYLAEATDRPTPTHPSKLSDSRMRKQVLTTGATKAYRERDISLSRGAELAGMSLDEFEAALSQQGIQPAQGPDADEELYDESEDWF